MAVPAFIFDGVAPYGTLGTLTIGGVTYVVEDLKVTPSWATAEDRTALGGPNRKRWTKGRYGLELKLQLATGSTAYPIPGATFSLQVKNETSASTFVVIEVPEEYNNDSGNITTVTVRCESVVNSITTA